MDIQEWRLMMINFTKDMIGKTIYGEPTGNNARREKDLKKFKVISIKRKYVELESEVGSTNLYDKVRGFTQSAQRAGLGLNSGYRFFLTPESYQEDLTKREQITRIRDVQIFGNSLEEFATPEEVQIIHDIMMKVKDRRNGI